MHSYKFVRRKTMLSRHLFMSLRTSIHESCTMEESGIALATPLQGRLRFGWRRCWLLLLEYFSLSAWGWRTFN